MQSDRILVFAPHFSELALRFSEALADDSKVFAIVDGRNFRAECADEFSFSSPNLTVLKIRFTKLIFVLFPFLLSLVWFRPTLVQFEEANYKWLPFLARIAKFFAPVVLRVHDPEPHLGRDQNYLRALKKQRDQLRNQVDAVLLHGPYCVAQFKKLYTTPVVETRHGMILVPSSRRVNEKQSGRILVFGRMETYKGLAVFLSALEILASRGIHPHVLIAGRGPKLDELELQFGQFRNVEINKTFLTPGEAVSAFQKSEIVILPYLEATQSGVAAAAMANGCLVIASNVGGLSEIVVDNVNGLLVGAGLPEELADAIAKVLDDSELRNRLCVGAENWTKSNLGWHEIAKKATDDLYNILKRSP
jgi:glycosyltransferase involved in cell wall biosynthesis